MKITSILVFFATLIVSGAFAHTKWFAEGDVLPLKTSEPTEQYLLVLGVIALTIIIIGAILEYKKMFQLDFLSPKDPNALERGESTFTIITGTFLVTAGTHEYLFSPNLIVESGVPLTLIVTQIFIGLAFLLGIKTRGFAIVLAMVWFLTLPHAGVIAMVENSWVLSTALFIFIMGNDYFSLISLSFFRKLCAPFKKYALSILRIGTGATLFILGFSEKILAPEYGMHFLEQHDWNFMKKLGFNFSDYLFTLSAGVVESVFGLVFMLGILTRINALIVAIVFLTPVFFLGPIELAGHLPHFAAVVLLLIFGNGGYFVLFKTEHEKDVV